MPRSLDLPMQHPLKKELQARGIPLWMIRDALGGGPSEFKISRMLNGIELMEEGIKNKIERYLFLMDQALESPAFKKPLL
jgi:hypothetical protein